MVGSWNDDRFSSSSIVPYCQCHRSAEYTVTHFIAHILCINVKAFNDLIDRTDQWVKQRFLVTHGKNCKLF